jgi:hypothetical protein
MCYEIMNAAKGSKLVVLPGVEISVQGGESGIHILALFEHGTTKETIIGMLNRVGITSSIYGKEEALTDKAIPDVLNEIHSINGVAIAAHTDQNKGLTNDLRGQQRIKFYNNEKLHGLEIVHKELSKIFDGSDQNYKRKLPCIQSSDAHSLRDIGQRFTLLKMDKPCLEGIRQAFLDPESRIRLSSAEKSQSYPYILGIEIKGGFLDGQILHFNKNLNCLIGGRGAGKTTTIELIRYCLDAHSGLNELRDRKIEMIKSVLGEGEISTFVQTKEGTVYKIKRKTEEKPQVFSLNNEKIDVEPPHLFQIVGYGETEIEKISFDASSQLALIDKFSEGIEV